MNRAEKATDYVMAKIAEGNPGKTIVIMADGPRKDIYDGTVEESNVLWENELLGETARKYGFHYLDLTGPFTDHFRENKA